MIVLQKAGIIFFRFFRIKNKDNGGNNQSDCNDESDDKENIGFSFFHDVLELVCSISILNFRQQIIDFIIDFFLFFFSIFSPLSQ